MFLDNVQMFSCFRLFIFLYLINEIIHVNLYNMFKTIYRIQDETNLDQFISSMEVGALAQGANANIRYKFGHVLNGFSVRIPEEFVDWVRLTLCFSF